MWRVTVLIGMFSYGKLSKRPSIFRSFSGLEVSEFDSLCANVGLSYVQYERERLSIRKDRKRKIGAGRPFKLPMRDRLLMLLIYYRLYVTFTLCGYLFDVDQSTVFRDMRILEPLVKECIPLPEKIYAATRRARTPEEVERYFPGFIAFIDGTEQEIPRPKSKAKRKSHYSGKKKRHTVKTQLTVNKEGLIVHRTPHARGRRHDYDIFKQSHPTLPPGVKPGVDLGYDGIQSDFPELNALIPFKKRRGIKELTEEQKLFNKGLASGRVVVEHMISRLKKFRIMGDEFRNRPRQYDRMSNIVCGLINLRILGKA